MGLHRMLNPELVLCSSCRSCDENESRWRAYASDRDNSVLVRDVCAAQACPAMQVRGHLCVDHVLQAELAWQHYFPLRACNFCCRDVMQLYSAKQEVWFICASNESTEQARGALRVATAAAAAATTTVEASSSTEWRHKGSKRSKKSKSRVNARNLRKRRQNRLKERLLALDWSIGNCAVAPMFLWKENRRRLDDEEKRARAALLGSGASENESEQPQFAYPDPTDVFCVVVGCRHFAKTGDTCRFHSTRPASAFLLTSTSVGAAAVAQTPTLSMRS